MTSSNLQSDLSSAMNRLQEIRAAGLFEVDGDGRATTKFKRHLTLRATNAVREYQQKIDDVVMDALAAIAEAIAELDSKMDQSIEASTQAKQSAEASAEEIRAISQASMAIHRRTEQMEAQLAVAVALNDELSQDVASMRQALELLSPSSATTVSSSNKAPRLDS